MSISSFTKEWRIQNSDTILLETGDTLQIQSGSPGQVSFGVKDDPAPGPWENISDGRWLPHGGHDGHLHGTIELSPGLSLPFSVTYFSGTQKNWISIRLTELPDMNGTIQITAHDGPP